MKGWEKKIKVRMKEVEVEENLRQSRLAAHLLPPVFTGSMRIDLP